MIPENKTRVQITVTKDELVEMQNAADMWGMTLSQYLSALCLNDREYGITAMLVRFASYKEDPNG